MRGLQSALIFKSDLIQATGIPPWIALLIELTDLKKEVEDLRHGIVEDIEKKLHENGAAAANITPDRLYEHLDQALSLPSSFLTIQALKAAVDARWPSAQAPTVAEATGANQSYSVHARGSRLSMFPHSFELPKKTNLGAAWTLWHLGRPVDGIPPLRHLAPEDFPLKSDGRKRLSDWRKMMQLLADQLGDIYNASTFSKGLLILNVRL
jgi:hypothetical protein